MQAWCRWHQKRASNLPELMLQTVMSHHMGAGNRTRFSQRVASALTLGHLSRSRTCFLKVVCTHTSSAGLLKQETCHCLPCPCAGYCRHQLPLSAVNLPKNPHLHFPALLETGVGVCLRHEGGHPHSAGGSWWAGEMA